jgi:2Fe-2S ferredoxin
MPNGHGKGIAVKIRVIDRDGADHLLDAEPGAKAMEVIRDAGLDIKAECGGNCICATCHVYVEEAWRDKLAPRLEDENETLSEAYLSLPASRLSCQIVLDDRLDGLTLTLAPEYSY